MKKSAPPKTPKRPNRAASIPEYLEVGERLRLARMARGLKMHEVAKAVGCSVSLISKYESEAAMPSLSTLHKIVGILGTNISALFDPPDSASGIVSRARERKTMKIEGRPNSACFSLEMLISHQANRQLQSMIYVVPPNAGNPEPVRHQGEETGYVLEGMLELIVDGRSYLLAAGDAFAFSSQQAHHFRNPGQITTRILWVNTPPTF
jgi:transcriptional regulator with XRE-family HTH domain